LADAEIYVTLHPYQKSNHQPGYGVFRAAVTPHLLMVGIGWALTIACLGAALPVRRVAHLTVIEALREP